MITIHSSTTTDFSNNGLAVLDPLSCNLTLQVNGAWSLEMECPFDEDNKYLYLKKGNIIKVTDINIIRELSSTYQLFRIYDEVRTLTSVKVIAFPVALEATYDAIIENYTTGSTSKTVAQIMSTTDGVMKQLIDAGVTKYTVSVDYSDSPSKTGSWENTNLIAMISGADDESIINKWGGELAYDNYNIKIKKELGIDTDYEIRYGKNLTGLEVDLDTSGIVTRFYPISKEGIRLNVNNKSYVESDIASEYPFTRGAFVQTDYPLVDTNEKSYSNAAILTREAKATIIEDITTVMESIWEDIKSGNKVNNQLYETEWMQKSLNDIIAEVQASTTLIPADSDAGLANLFRTCIKSGINWIKDEDIADYEWKTVSGDKYYGNSDRDLNNQYYYIDKMYRWFDENGIYHPEKDLNTMDWLNHIGQQQIGTPTKGFGNDTSTIARDAWVFTMDGDNQTGSNFNQYYFDADGCWDGASEASEWDWQQTDNKWWFGKTGATDPKDYAHDEWVYIYKSSGTAPSNTPKLYYFGSDGYVLYDKSCSWNWYENKQKLYFGVAVTESNRIYLKNQWMKIDGDWYYFNNQELVAKDKTIRLGLVNYIVSQINNLGDFSEYTTRLYNRLYQSMYEYCESLYDEEGYDKPSITVNVNLVDLSQTTEYEDYSSLETIHLGDKVKVIDYAHFPDLIELDMRVVGLTYDCIRGYNTQVTIGQLSKTVAQMISPSLGNNDGQRLVAGDNVTIDGNVINAVTNVGDIYAGSQVDVEQVVTSGTELAKVYVDGVPTSIYGSKDVEVTRNLTEGTQIADIKVGNQHNYLFAPNGLRYWTETETEIYNNGETEGMSADASYSFTEYFYNSEVHNVTFQDANWRKKNNELAIAAQQTTNFILVSCESAEAVEFEVQTLEISHGEYYYSEWREPINSPRYSPNNIPNIQRASFTYMGRTWWASYGANWSTQWSDCPFPVIDPLDFNLPYYGNDYSTADLIAASKNLIDKAHATPYRPDKEGISNQDHILFYNSYPNDPNHEDDVFVSKRGVFHGTRYEDADGNPISGGGLSKTELYSGSSYAASIVLSSAYTGYQFLLIQTYNADDKEALSTMLNVSDLVAGQRIGINDYLLYTITDNTTLTFYSSFDDTNHTRHIKGIYGLKTFNGSDVPNIITDVKDGDTSVVSGGVAQIGGKQDKLTAGQNIQIAADGKTISATDTTYNEFAGSAAGLVPSVQTQAGKFLKDDGTWATASGASSVDTLTDVDLTNLANGQILKYNSTSQKWENANEVSYSDFAGSAHGLVPAVSTQEGKYLKDDGSWDTPASGSTSLDGLNDVDLTSPTDGQILKYDANNQEWVNANESGGGGFIEVTTDILTGQHMNWDKKTTGGMACSIYTDTITHLSFGITSSYTDSDRVMAVYTLPIPTTAKKIRYKIYERRNDAQDPSQDMYKACIGVKTTLDTQNYTTPTDNDFIAKNLHQFTAYATVVEGELEFESTSPVYLYITANGFACDFDVIEVVEYKANLGDLDDVDISSPTNGQVLTYNSTSQQWENATPSGGASYTDVTGTLLAGSTSITLSDASIDSTKTFDFYTDTFGVNPTAVSVSSGSITLTFEAQSSAVDVKVRVW